MRLRQVLPGLAVVGLVVALFAGCTSNPFADDDIGAGRQAIRGSLRLDDNASPAGLYVWLEGFNIGTITDNAGQFQLTLPPPGAQSGGGIDGSFQLYFYAANYELETAQVVTQGGSFLFDRADLNAKGELKTARSLQKFARIITEVSPAVVAPTYQFRIGVQVTVQATIDSATVIFPGTVGGLLGPILFRNTTTGTVVTFEPTLNAPTDVQNVGRSPLARVQAFSLAQIPGLGVGEWEVIPFIFLAHNNVPAELLQSISPQARHLGPEYLKIPFRREGGRFIITETAKATSGAAQE